MKKSFAKHIQTLLILSFVNLLTLLSVQAQNWTDIVSISKTGSNVNPDFFIDRNGVIHCVFISYLDNMVSRVFYSKSENDGISWSDPIPLTTNTSLWLNFPHIVGDSNGNLYVSYDYNVMDYIKTQIAYVKFNAINSIWEPQKIISYGSMNKLVIDHNDRIYFFWNAGYPFYIYLEGEVFSDTIKPVIGTNNFAWFYDVVVDRNNNLHCAGNRQVTQWSRGAYFRCIDGVWMPYVDLRPEAFQFPVISINNEANPSFVWQQHPVDSASNVRATYFGELEDDTILTPYVFPTKNSYPATYADLAIDMNDSPHVVECQPNDSGYSLMHRYNTENKWIYNIIEENVNWYNGVNIKPYGSKIYLIYNKVDTTYFSPSSFNSDILFRKLEILPGILSITSKSKIKAYPNPFSDYIILEIPELASKIITLKVFDISGSILYEEIQDVTTTLSGVICWQGRNKSGSRVANGYYLLQISDGQKSFQHKVVKLDY